MANEKVKEKPQFIAQEQYEAVFKNSFYSMLNNMNKTLIANLTNNINNDNNTSTDNRLDGDN